MICKYAQYRLSSLEGTAPTGRLHKHVQTCSDCENYLEKLALLDHVLSSSASQAPRPITPEKQGLRLGIVFSMGALAAVAAAALLWSGSEPPPDQTHTEPRVAVTVPVSNTPETATSLSRTISLSKLSVIHQVTPLEHELDAWRDDGRRGLRQLLSLGQQ